MNFGLGEEGGLLCRGGLGLLAGEAEQPLVLYSVGRKLLCGLTDLQSTRVLSFLL